MEYKLYRLFSLEEPENTRYIGLTKCPLSNRLSKHKCSARYAHKNNRAHMRTYRWILSIDYKVGIELIDIASSLEEANIKETILVKKYKDLGYDLVNTLPGGDCTQGMSYSLNGRAKRVLQYDLEGNFIQEWSCMKEASDYLKINEGLISGCIRMDRIKSAGGYLWKNYEEDFDIKISSYKETLIDIRKLNSDKFGKKLYQYDLNGKFIKEWESFRGMERETGFFRESIKDYIEGKTQHAYCYLWSNIKMDNLKPFFEKDYSHRCINIKWVYQYLEDGTFVRAWTKINYIAKSLNVCSSAISLAISRGNLVSGKYRFFYEKNN